MASGHEEEISLDGDNLGRRTRSARKTSTITTMPRATRSSTKKQTQEQIVEPEKEIINEDNYKQSDIIKEMLAEAAQGVILDESFKNEDQCTESIDESVKNEYQCTESIDDIQNSANLINEVEDHFVEISNIPQESDEQSISSFNVLEVQNYENIVESSAETQEIVLETENLLEERSTEDDIVKTEIENEKSSFPFHIVQQIENVENKTDNNIENISECADSSLLPNIDDNAKENVQFSSENATDEVAKEQNIELSQSELQAMKIDFFDNSDSKSSQPAIAEELTNGGNLSDRTLQDVDAEMISEDELLVAMPTNVKDAENVSDDELSTPIKPPVAGAEVVSEDELTVTTPVKVNDAEEVSDDELPEIARAELPADTENVSEEELPSVTKKSIKRKANEYDHSSSTVEESKEVPEKRNKIDSKEEESDEKENQKKENKLPELDKYWKIVKDDPADFTGWTYLLQYVDQEDDVEAAREAYDAFLEHYPYCYGYWRKYADYEKRRGNKDRCEEVFKKGLQAIPLSVDLWIHYLAHVKANYADNEEYIREQFEKSLLACGLEFRSDKLWEAFIKWETERKCYLNVAKIYDRLLATPTQGYSTHFDSYQDLVNNHLPTEIVSIEEFKRIRSEVREFLENTSQKISEKDRKSESKPDIKQEIKSESKSDSKLEFKEDKQVTEKDKHDKEYKAEVKKDVKNEETKDDSKLEHKKDIEIENKESIKISNNESSEEVANEKPDVEMSDEKEQVIAKEEHMVVEGEEHVSHQEEPEADDHIKNDEELHAIRDRIISSRRKIHKITVSAVTARWTYEEAIKRPYFHVKPLERCQLKNWKEYLDFEIEKGDRKRILILFERCLIACALYDEFWLKLIRYLESQNDPKLVPLTRDVYQRACKIHHPDKPSLHLMWSAFEECQNNFDVAAEVLINIEKQCPNLLQIAYRRINLERRRGNFEKCKELYEYYMSTAKNKNICGSLAIKYARFLHKICGNIDTGINILKQTLEKDQGNTRVALQMVDLALQRTQVDEEEIVEIMDKFMSRENMDPDQRVLFAQRKVEFLEDFGSTAKGLQDAQRALQIALNKANEAKKKSESSSVTNNKKIPVTTKEPITVTNPSSGSIVQNTPTVYNNNFSGYNTASAQNPQYYGNNQGHPHSYDSYSYNHWQQTGYNYSGYGQWSGYGNYY